MTERVLPHSLDAERAVLAGVVMKNDAFDVVSPLLTPDDFYSPANATVFEAMQNLRRHGQPIDTLTLMTELKGRDALERAGGSDHLLRLTESAPIVANIEVHASIVKENAAVRRISVMARQISEVAYFDTAAFMAGGDYLAAVEKNLLEAIERERAGTRPARMITHLSDAPDGDALGQTFDPPPMALAFRGADGHVRGAVPAGGVTVLSGIFGGGKSTLAQQASLTVARGQLCEHAGIVSTKAGRVLVVSAEEPLTRLASRFRSICDVMGIEREERIELQTRLSVVGRERCGRLGELVRGRVQPTSAMQRILHEAGKVADEWALVVVDTFARTAPNESEENAGVATDFVQLLERFAELPGAPAVLCLHHPTKASFDPKKVRQGLFSKTDARGSGGVVGAARALLNLVTVERRRPEEGGDLLALGVAKGNDVREGQWLPLIRGREGCLFAPEVGSSDHRLILERVEEGRDE